MQIDESRLMKKAMIWLIKSEWGERHEGKSKIVVEISRETQEHPSE